MTLVRFLQIVGYTKKRPKEVSLRRWRAMLRWRRFHRDCYDNLQEYV